MGRQLCSVRRTGSNANQGTSLSLGALGHEVSRLRSLVPEFPQPPEAQSCVELCSVIRCRQPDIGKYQRLEIMQTASAQSPTALTSLGSSWPPAVVEIQGGINVPGLPKSLPNCKLSFEAGTAQSPSTVQPRGLSSLSGWWHGGSSLRLICLGT